MIHDSILNFALVKWIFLVEKFMLNHEAVHLALDVVIDTESGSVLRVASNIISNYSIMLTYSIIKIVQ